MVVRVTVTLPDDLLAELDEFAAGDDVTRSEVVREAAARYVVERRSGQIASERERSVEAGVDWLESLAEKHEAAPASIELLRELRAGGDAGRPIEPGEVEAT